VEAPIAEAQLIETLVINYLHYQSMVASKAARMVLAAPNAQLIDFGLRRSHSLEAGTYAARAAYLAGFASTASVCAARWFDIPVSGTMAHSFVQAHDSEAEAFRHFAAARPADVTFLIDTYDTEAAAQTVVAMAPSLIAQGVRIHAVRIDSGDLSAHARAVRAILDAGGLHYVKIIASGGIDEWSLYRLVQTGAPIDIYGVGTSLVTSEDAPALDCAYKLVSFAGIPRRKRSEGKLLWPGAKQVFRHYATNGRLDHDVLALADESLGGEPLLRTVMRTGRREPQPNLAQSRSNARANLDRLPDELRMLDVGISYRVDVSEGLANLAASMDAQGR
jgi:nicotinate phosphoribosyltransferase